MLIETGLTFLNSLIKNKVINDMYIFQSNKKLGTNGYNNATSSYLKKIQSKQLKVDLGDDNIFKKEF